MPWRTDSKPGEFGAMSEVHDKQDMVLFSTVLGLETVSLYSAGIDEVDYNMLD